MTQKQFFQFAFSMGLVIMLILAIVMTIAQPKEIGNYCMLALSIFFNVVGYLAMYNKNNKIYIALHDPNLGEENDGENN